jgi:lipopolysaccharide transport system ATP-binding protein
LSLNNVGIHYGHKIWSLHKPFWALKDVTFELYHGETLGIIGRNGVGKSTLLKVMSGIIKPNRGQFINQNNSTASLLSLQLGFVEHLNGRENAILSGMFLGMRKKEIIAKLPAIIEFADLGEFIDHPVGTYSSGMSARLGFSVAFQTNPDILLVDEVLGVGDANFMEKSAKVMQEKIKSNKTVVFVSHNGDLIKKLCNRVVWIEDGISRMEGDPDEVLNEYHKYLLESKNNT